MQNLVLTAHTMLVCSLLHMPQTITFAELHHTAAFNTPLFQIFEKTKKIHRAPSAQYPTDAPAWGPGMHYVSAPVFGRPDAAWEHQVLFAVAGAKQAKQQLQLYFTWMGRGTLVCSDLPSCQHLCSA